MTNNTNLIKSVVPAIAALVYRAKEAQDYMEPKTCALAAYAIYNMLTMFTRTDNVPAISMVELAKTSIDKANRYNNDMAEFHYKDEPIKLIGLAKHFGFVEMSEDKSFHQTDRWIEIVTPVESATPLTSKPTAETRRKPFIKGGKVKPSKLLAESIDFLESTEYHVEQKMVQIIQGLLKACGNKVPDAIQQEWHVWTNSEAAAFQDSLFSEYFADNRGRLYHVACAGPNPQSSDFSRSLYSLNVSAPVNKLESNGEETAAYRMFMLELSDLASGLWLTPKWLTRVAQNPVGSLKYMLDFAQELSNSVPKKPFTYVRLALDWFEFETTGSCDSRVGFGLDAKCSGTQYLAFTAGNIEMARATGLVDSTTKAPDPYQLSLVQLMKLLNKSSLRPSGEIMDEYLNPKTGRNFIKTPYMAIQYGGGVGALVGSKKFANYACHELQIPVERLADFAELCKEAIHIALGAKINQFITKTQEAVAKKLAETGRAYLTYRHTDGMLVHKPCFPSREICDAFSIRIDSQTRVIFGQQLEGKPWEIRESNPTADEFVRTFVVNFIQGIDALVARTVSKYAMEAGLRGYTSIHDCFRCTLADAPKMMAVIRKAYIEIFVKNNQFENLSKQLGGIEMYNENIVTEELLNSEFAYYFCQ